VLGRAAPDVNVNALDVQPLVGHAGRRASAPDLVSASAAPAADAFVDDEDSDSSVVTGGSQSQSDPDDLAEEGFDSAVWQCVFDSALPVSDTNQCLPPISDQNRRRRRSGDDASSCSSASDSDDLIGVPPFQRHQHKPRARRIPRDCKTPLQFVQLLFPDALVNNLVFFTNAAARQHPRLASLSRFSNWKDVTLKEMLKFLSICVYLGVVKVQNRKLLWSKDGVFAQPCVSQLMSLRRFENLLNAFNCVAYWNLSEEEVAAKNSENCFWQVQDLVDACNRRSQHHFKMGHAFSIDEAVIPWKGRHKARCYNPKKPSKYHLKKFSLNCSSTGYVYCFYHYPGKDERRPAGCPATTWPIRKLIEQSLELHHKNHFCSTDNWYTSASSLSYLRSVGIHCAGTIKAGRLSVATANRPGFPAAATFKSGRGRSKRARADCMIHKTQINGYDAYVTSWQDKKPVLILTSYRPCAGECVRKVKVGRRWTQMRFFRPNVVQHYNSTMGGTDLHDQRLAHLRTTVKSRRWQVISSFILMMLQVLSFVLAAPCDNGLVFEHAHECICIIQVARSS
jgi:hypothetical protein